MGYDVKDRWTSVSHAVRPLLLELRFGTTKRGQATVNACVDLGAAQRELLPRALEMNQDFEFGQIGLTVDSETKEERFLFVDKRPYHDLRGKDYYWILKSLVIEARRALRELNLAETS